MQLLIETEHPFHLIEIIYVTDLNTNLSANQIISYSIFVILY